MIPKDTKLLRLASARLDMGYSLDAYAHLRDVDPRSDLFLLRKNGAHFSRSEKCLDRMRSSEGIQAPK